MTQKITKKSIIITLLVASFIFLGISLLVSQRSKAETDEAKPVINVYENDYWLELLRLKKSFETESAEAYNHHYDLHNLSTGIYQCVNYDADLTKWKSIKDKFNKSMQKIDLITGNVGNETIQLYRVMELTSDKIDKTALETAISLYEADEKLKKEKATCDKKRESQPVH